MSGIGEGTGGVTEGLRRRIVMPVFGTLEETDHVLGHELVHAFQHTTSRKKAVKTAPLGADSRCFRCGSSRAWPSTCRSAMSIRTRPCGFATPPRDKEKLPSVDQLDDPQNFPYRWGQAFWAYVAGRWGDNIVRRMLDEAIALGGASPIERVLSMKDEELSAQWHEAISAHAQTLEAGARASKTGRALAPDAKRERLAIAPSLSPDGRHVVYLSERDMLSIDMYLAEVETGRIVRRLTNTAIDPHFNSIQFLASAGAWHPSDHQFVFGAIKDAYPYWRSSIPIRAGASAKSRFLISARFSIPRGHRTGDGSRFLRPPPGAPICLSTT